MLRSYDLGANSFVRKPVDIAQFYEAVRDGINIARYALITYDRAYSSGLVVMREFEKHGLTPRIAMKATDANVIKAYVAAGLGISVLQKMAIEPRDRLAVIDAPDLFPPSQTYISLRRGQHLRGYVYGSLAQVAPHWNRAAVMKYLQRPAKA